MWAGCVKLKYLDLSDNKLTTLTEDNFGEISKESLEIDLYENPLRCDCSSASFRRWYDDVSFRVTFVFIQLFQKFYSIYGGWRYLYNPAQVTSKHKHRCCPCPKMGRFCLFAYTVLSDRFTCARGLLYNLESLLKLMWLEKITCWFWKNLIW